MRPRGVFERRCRSRPAQKRIRILGSVKRQCSRRPGISQRSGRFVAVKFQARYRGVDWLFQARVDDGIYRRPRVRHGAPHIAEQQHGIPIQRRQDRRLTGNIRECRAIRIGRDDSVGEEIEMVFRVSQQL